MCDIVYRGCSQDDMTAIENGDESQFHSHNAMTACEHMAEQPALIFTPLRETAVAYLKMKGDGCLIRIDLNDCASTDWARNVRNNDETRADVHIRASAVFEHFQVEDTPQDVLDYWVAQQKDTEGSPNA